MNKRIMITALDIIIIPKFKKQQNKRKFVTQPTKMGAPAPTYKHDLKYSK